MRLQIENCAKIKNAEIIIDGITVIAGENNSGKSTIGKILYTLFNALSDLENKITEQRKQEIRDVIYRILRNYTFHSRISSTFYVMVSINIANSVVNLMQEAPVGRDAVERVVHTVIANEKGGTVLDEEDYEIETELTDKIVEMVNLSDFRLMQEVLTRYIQRVFNDQINSLFDLNTEARMQLSIRNHNVGICFQDNACKYIEKDIEILNKAIYIDNPFLVDKLSSSAGLDEMGFFLRSLLTKNMTGNVMDGIIGSVLAKEKLEDVYKMLYTVVPGKIVEGQENEYFLEQDNLEKPVAFSQLSTGMKSFLIIRMLLEKGCIEEKDVLILDEPEIHLHPQWQVVYAELIVLLQKYFNLSMVITTHSPYFLDAVHIFSEKYGIGEKTNFYLASVDDQWARVEKVTDNLELIYKKMADPIQMLDSLRYELNNQ